MALVFRVAIVCLLRSVRQAQAPALPELWAGGVRAIAEEDGRGAVVEMRHERVRVPGTRLNHRVGGGLVFLSR